MDSTPRARPSVRRTSLLQPLYRRPFYAKSELAYATYTDGRLKTRDKGIDYGLDNFSYDPDFLTRWLMDSNTSEKIPEELLEQAENWQCSAAALETAIDRTAKLYAAAHSYAYQARPNLPRPDSVSTEPPHIVNTDTPATPITPSTLIEKVSLPNAKLPLLQLAPNPHMLAVESPPMSPPALSFSSGSSVDGDHTLPALDTTDAAMIPAEAVPTSPQFNEITWETYLGKWHQHTADLRKCWTRLEGYGRKINRLCSEMGNDRNPATKKTLVEFIKWWAPMERVFVPELEFKVNAIEDPELSYIQLEHAAKAMAGTATSTWS